MIKFIRWGLPLLALATAVVGVVVYRSERQVGWVWTGFGEYYDASGEYHPQKQLWDFLELLIIPAVLGGLALWFDWRERKADREVAESHQRETNLQAYWDKMSELLLKEDLENRSRVEGDAFRNVAQTRTSTLLRSLDGGRRNLVTQFLRDAGLSGSLLKKASLENIDLRGVDLEGFDLSGADLRGADLSEGNLVEAILNEADLSEVNLRGTKLVNAKLKRVRQYFPNKRKMDLQGADLTGADLTSANLREARLKGAILAETQMPEVILRHAYLGGADLTGASLGKAQLNGADLREAKLEGTNLVGADLSAAKVDWEELMRVGSQTGSREEARANALADATMPDGRRYDRAVHRPAEPGFRLYGGGVSRNSGIESRKSKKTRIDI